MSSSRHFPTRRLLVCAALGVAGGLLLAPMNWVSTMVFTAAPMLSLALTGVWLLPAVVALRLLRKPFVGILVGLISGLVAAPLSGYGFASVQLNVSFALFAELPFLLVGWRRWTRWQHYLGAAAMGVFYPASFWTFFGLSAQPLWAQTTYFALSIASCLAATALGIALAERLRKAGVSPSVG